MAYVARTKPAPALFSQARAANSPLLSDLVAEQVSEMIRSGQLATDARLPAEREMAEQLGVSRTVLREALRILEKSGLLRVSRGRGRFVTGYMSTRPTPFGASGWLQLHREEVAELNHVLQLIEPEAVLEIPTHLIPQVAYEARALYERAVTAIEAGDTRAAAEIDSAFHVALCRSAPNRLLRDLALQLIESATDATYIVYEIPAAARHSLTQHLAIVQALEAGSREKASRLVREHAATAYRYAMQHDDSAVASPRGGVREPHARLQHSQ